MVEPQLAARQKPPDFAKAFESKPTVPTRVAAADENGEVSHHRAPRYAPDALQYSTSQGSARFESPGWAVFSSGGCDYARIETRVVCGDDARHNANTTNATNATTTTNATHAAHSANSTNCTTVRTKVARAGTLGACDWIATEDECTTAALTLGLGVRLLVRTNLCLENSLEGIATAGFGLPTKVAPAVICFQSQPNTFRPL